MSFLGTLRAAFGYGASLDNPEQGYQTAGQLTGGRNDTDTTLTDERALSLSAVWACTRLIVQTGSSMPVKAYRETPLGRDLVPYDDPTATVLRQPNPLMTGAQFRAAIWTQRVLWGNGFAEIRRDSRGVVRSLWPLRPAHMSVERRGADLVYSYSTEEGVRELRKDQVFHVRGFSPDGIIGLSPLSYMRYAAAVNSAADRRAARSFAGTPNGFLRMQEWPTPEQREQIRDMYANLGTAETGDGQFWILPGGMEFDDVGLPPDDLQMLQSRQFQLSEIARFFGVPSVLLDANAGTAAAWPARYEQQNLAFLQHTLRPYIEEFEDAFRQSVIPPMQRRDTFIEHDVQSMLRADSASRSSYYATMVSNGLMTTNEIRAMENLPPVDGGDVVRAQINMAPINELGDSDVVPQ